MLINGTAGNRKILTSRKPQMWWDPHPESMLKFLHDFVFLFYFFPTVTTYKYLYVSIRIIIFPIIKRKLILVTKGWNTEVTFSAISLFVKGHATIIKRNVMKSIVHFSYYCWNSYWLVLFTFPVSKKHLLLFENIDYITGTIYRDFRVIQVMKTVTLKTLRCSNFV